MGEVRLLPPYDKLCGRGKCVEGKWGGRRVCVDMCEEGRRVRVDMCREGRKTCWCGHVWGWEEDVCAWTCEEVKSQTSRWRCRWAGPKRVRKDSAE
eukprot:171570-Chlamydomonas_euryale.AAC.2